MKFLRDLPRLHVQECAGCMTSVLARQMQRSLRRLWNVSLIRRGLVGDGTSRQTEIHGQVLNTKTELL